MIFCSRCKEKHGDRYKLYLMYPVFTERPDETMKFLDCWKCSNCGHEHKKYSSEQG
jgi:hypothetical protein